MISFRTWHAVALATLVFASFVPASHSVVYTYKADDNYEFDYEIFSGEGNKPSLRLWIRAKTAGWVGFGVGPEAGMTGADIFVGGRNGNANYENDYHATTRAKPTEDANKDWFLEEGGETNGVTSLVVRRFLDTGDATQDYPITDTEMNVIWAIGTSDELAYHGSKGAIKLNLMAPGQTPTTTVSPPTPTTAGASLPTTTASLLAAIFTLIMLAQ